MIKIRLPRKLAYRRMLKTFSKQVPFASFDAIPFLQGETGLPIYYITMTWNYRGEEYTGTFWVAVSWAETLHKKATYYQVLTQFLLTFCGERSMFYLEQLQEEEGTKDVYRTKSTEPHD